MNETPTKTTVRIRRVISLEYVISDMPGDGENRWDDLATATDDEIILEERGIRLADWANTTEFTVADDEITVVREGGES